LTRNTTILDWKYEMPGLDRLLKHKRKFRKLWQETKNPVCKTAVNWVTRNIRRMIRKRALERWEIKLANCEVTPQAIWLIAKSLTKRDEPKASSAILGSLGPIFYSIDKANIIAYCSDNRFTAHDLCGRDHRQHLEAEVEALLATVDEDTS
jgi:hypothetical protein